MTITSLSLDCRVYTQKVIVSNILGYILKIFSVYTQKVIVTNILGYILNIFSVCTEKVIVSNILGYILNIFSVYTQKVIVSNILGNIQSPNAKLVALKLCVVLIAYIAMFGLKSYLK